MNRAPWYLLAGAIAGFAGILGLHSKAAPAALAPQHRGSAAGGRTGGLAGSAGTQGSGQTAGPSAPSGTGGKARTATGAMERYGYGELDVKVTVSGSRITNVTVPAVRAPEQYSQQLAAQVIPMLKSQVMAIDSARIHGVSGATYTSEAYAYSLQSALDKLHFK
ncbi:MAG: FMN-binding protein [Actinobacteria bacterium]|nr:FMN-binding protein [Actinomycetota bacterium]